ncbi:MAG: HAD-IA family hydrolase [Planctomycetota bacterium]
MIFDFDDTLVDFDQSEWLSARRFFQTVEAVDDPSVLNGLADCFAKLNPTHWPLRHEIGVSAVFQKTIEAVYATLLPTQTPPSDSGQRYLDSFARTVHLDPDCENTLALLSGHARLFIVSNGLKSIQAQRIHSTGISNYFADIIVSGDIGVAKPDRQIFDRLIQANHIERDRAIYIGDSIRDDYAGCCNCGIDFCFYNRRRVDTSAYDFVHEIQTLDELPSLLGFG